MTSMTFDAAGVPRENTVPPPLRGWLVAFAVMRGYAATSIAISLYRQLFLMPSWITADVRAQLATWTMLSALWLALEVVGLILLLRRDGRAPAYWIGLLLAKLGWLGVTVLPNLAKMPLQSSTVVFGVALPGLWLALWLTSPLVARTFGPAAERRHPSPRRALPAGDALGGALLGVLWIAALAASVWVGGAGDWKIFVFIVYSVLALPLWVVTWLWARRNGVAVRGSGWLALGWIVVALAPLAAPRASAVLPAAVVAALRGLDLVAMAPTMAFAMAMYTIGRALLGGRGAAPPAADAG